jgi:hypothetical protein
LLDFHDFIDRLEIIHEDVQIKLFKFSLEGIALDWCRSLPSASVCSLADFHAAFHVFCKDHFSDDLLYPECCHDFNLLNKKSDSYVKYATAGDASHHDQDIDDLQDDGHSIDALNSTPNASTILDCYQDHIASFEKLKDDEQIESSTGESIGATIDVEGSPHLPDLQTKGNCNNHEEQNLQGLPNLQFEHQKDLLSPYEYSISNYDEERGEVFPNLFHDVIVDPAIQEASSLSLGSYLDPPIFDQYGDEKGNVKVCEDLFFIQISSSSSFQQRDDQKYVHVVIDACRESVEDLSSLDISRKDIIIGKEIVCCVKPAYHLDEIRLQRYGAGEQKGSDQLLSLHFSLTKVEQSTFSTEISESNQQLKYSQLDQQLKEVFFHGFYDPITNYLESMSSINIKTFLSDEGQFCFCYQLYFCMIWLPSFFGLRSRTVSVNQFLTWLHWKHDFT